MMLTCLIAIYYLLAYMSQALLMDGAEDPFQNPFQDTPLRPQSCPPATGIIGACIIVPYYLWCM